MSQLYNVELPGEKLSELLEETEAKVERLEKDLHAANLRVEEIEFQLEEAKRSLESLSSAHDSYRMVNGTLKWASGTTTGQRIKIHSLSIRIKELLHQKPGLTANELIAETGAPSSSVYRALEIMTNGSDVKKEKSGWHLLRPYDPDELPD